MKLVALTVAVTLAAALLAAGCGGGSGGTSSPNPTSTVPKASAPNAPAGSKVVSCTEGRLEASNLRAAAVDCDVARATMQRWQSSHACTLGAHGSRSSCSIGGFRCQAVRVQPGAEVTCARPGADVSFVTKSWLLKKSDSG
jgi:hypothetical protein